MICHSTSKCDFDLYLYLGRSCWTSKACVGDIKETLVGSKHKEYEFAWQYLRYLTHVIGRVDLDIDQKNINAFVKWTSPMNVTKFRSFAGASRNPRKFKVLVLVVAMPLNVVTTSGHIL